LTVEAAPVAAARRPPVLLLVGMAAIGAFALNVFVPSIPGLAAYFHTDLATIQLALSLYFVVIAAGQLIYGPLSDRFGRRPVLLGGLVIYAAASLACAMAQSVEALIAARMVQALGACSGIVISRAIVRDVYDRATAASALGYITSAMAAVPALAPAVGGYLDLWFGWRASFVATLLFGLAVLAGTIPAGHETNRRIGAGSGGIGRSYLVLLRSPAFLGYAFNVAMTTAAYFAFLAAAPVLMIDVLGLATSETGVWFISISGAYMLGNYLAGRYSRRIGLDRMIALGSTAAVLCAAVLLAFAVAGVLSPLAIFGPATAMGFVNGLSQPNGIAGAISADPRFVGGASGLLGFLQMGVGAAATMLVGHLHDGTLVPLALVMTGCAVIGVLVLRLTRAARSGILA
jgi:DHA1 family bicyclomycin/chloramphenicol resistance-like MFS transporter